MVSRQARANVTIVFKITASFSVVCLLIHDAWYAATSGYALTGDGALAERLEEMTVAAGVYLTRAPTVMA